MRILVKLWVAATFELYLEVLLELGKVLVGLFLVEFSKKAKDVQIPFRVNGVIYFHALRDYL